MDVLQAHSLYCAGHASARGLSAGAALGATDLYVSGAGLTPLERVLLEFALHDVTNGTAMRSLESFARAVEEGADLLRTLGLRSGASPESAADGSTVHAAGASCEGTMAQARRGAGRRASAPALIGAAAGAQGIAASP